MTWYVQQIGFGAKVEGKSISGEGLSTFHFLKWPGSIFHRYFCRVNTDTLGPEAQKTLQRFRIIGLMEAISYLVLLFYAMPMKYLYGEPYWVQKVGMLHGWLFVLYMILLVLAKKQCAFSVGLTIRLFVFSVIPFGTFYADWKYLKSRTK